jgi:hypothetical protein
MLFTTDAGAPGVAVTAVVAAPPAACLPRAEPDPDPDTPAAPRPDKDRVDDTKGAVLADVVEAAAEEVVVADEGVTPGAAATALCVASLALPTLAERGLAFAA